jgi:hypothetical protein
LQQHDGLAICGLATVDHRNRLVEPEFEHFDILAFACDAAAVADAVTGCVLPDKKVEALGDRSGQNSQLPHDVVGRHQC